MKIALIIISAVVIGILLYFSFRPNPLPVPAVLTDATSPKSPVRETLFGDMPIEQWATDNPAAPWTHFVEAKRRLEAGEKDAAAAALKKVVDTPNLEPRHYLQAWHFLRSLGHNPPPGEAHRVLGVVVEVPVRTGLDLVAAYTDHTARYYNFTGASIVWEHPDTSLDADIDKLLTAATTAVKHMNPSEAPRPVAPPMGQVRVSFLTPAGISFGQGTFEVLQDHSNGAPVVSAASELMLALMKKTEKPAPENTEK